MFYTTFICIIKKEIVCMVVLVVGSESSQNWVRVVSCLGPIRLGSEKYQGSELSWVRVVRLPYSIPMLRRPPVRRPSSTISKIFFSETAGPIVLILHIHHLQVGGNNNCVFCFDRIRTLVAMATYASHRLIMEKK